MASRKNPFKNGFGRLVGRLKTKEKKQSYKIFQRKIGIAKMSLKLEI